MREDYQLLIQKQALLTDQANIARMLHGERSWAYRKANFKSALSVQHSGILLDIGFGVSHLMALTALVPQLNFLQVPELAYSEAATVVSCTLATSVHWRINSGRINKHQRDNDILQALKTQPDAAHTQIISATNRKQIHRDKHHRQRRDTAIDAFYVASGLTDFVIKHFASSHFAMVATPYSGPIAGVIMAARHLYRAYQSYQQAKQAEQANHPAQMWLDHYDKLELTKAQLALAIKNKDSAQIAQAQQKLQQYQAQVDAIYHVIKNKGYSVDDLTAKLDSEQSFHFKASFKANNVQCQHYNASLHSTIVNNLKAKNNAKARRLKWDAGFKGTIAIGFALLAVSPLIPVAGPVLATIGLGFVAVVGVIQAGKALSQWNNNVVTAIERKRLQQFEHNALQNFTIPKPISTLLNGLGRSAKNPNDHIVIGDTADRKHLALAYYYHCQLDPAPIDLSDDSKVQQERKKFQRFFDTLQHMPKDQRRCFFEDLLERYREDRSLIKHTFGYGAAFDPNNQSHMSYLQSLSKKQRTTCLKQAIAAEATRRRELADAHKKHQQAATKTVATPPKSRPHYVKLGSNPWLACQPA